jgi:NifU-like protein
VTVTDVAHVSPAVAARLKSVSYRGDFTEANAQARGCRLIATEHGAQNAPDHINLFLVVDPQGVVKDARFRSSASGELLAAYDVMCELVIGKSIAEAATVSPRLVEAHLRGAESEPAMALALDADTPFYVLRKAAERWQQPAPVTVKDLKPFAECGLFERVKRIEAVLDQHVRPALASDGGGLDLVDLKNDDLFVQYHGACGSCSSSVGGTLQFITDSLNNHLAAKLAVHVSGMDEEAAAPFPL